MQIVTKCVSEMYVGCCKTDLGIYTPPPCKINECGKLIPTFIPSVYSAIIYRKGLHPLSVLFFCAKQGYCSQIV